MTTPRQIHAGLVLLLPILVAALDLSVGAALAMVVILLAWRWALSLSGIAGAGGGTRLVLDTMPASHFVEKVRWCLDRLGAEYAENANVGVLGVLFTGRTVPRLRFSSGIVESRIGNSPEILRYLWGAYGSQAGKTASFLEPTEERLQLERRLERYGVNQQVWFYYHMLESRELTLHAFGADSDRVPRWQRLAVRPLYPLLKAFLRRAFKINASHYARVVTRIEELLNEVDTLLADGRRSILGGAEPDFADITFAALSGLWLQPPGYGGGRAEGCLLDRERLPAAMQNDIRRWIADYPRAVAFVERLYRDERRAGTKDIAAGPTTQVHDQGGDSR